MEDYNNMSLQELIEVWKTRPDGYITEFFYSYLVAFAYKRETAKQILDNGFAERTFLDEGYGSICDISHTLEHSLFRSCPDIYTKKLFPVIVKTFNGDSYKDTLKRRTDWWIIQLAKDDVYFAREILEKLDLEKLAIAPEAKGLLSSLYHVQKDVVTEAMTPVLARLFNDEEIYKNHKSFINDWLIRLSNNSHASAENVMMELAGEKLAFYPEAESLRGDFSGTLTGLALYSRPYFVKHVCPVLVKVFNESDDPKKRNAAIRQLHLVIGDNNAKAVWKEIDSDRFDESAQPLLRSFFLSALDVFGKTFTESLCLQNDNKYSTVITHLSEMESERLAAIKAGKNSQQGVSKSMIAFVQSQLG